MDFVLLLNTFASIFCRESQPFLPRGRVVPESPRKGFAFSPWPGPWALHMGQFCSFGPTGPTRA